VISATSVGAGAWLGGSPACPLVTLGKRLVSRGAKGGGVAVSHRGSGRDHQSYLWSGTQYPRPYAEEQGQERVYTTVAALSPGVTVFVTPSASWLCDVKVGHEGREIERKGMGRGRV